MNKVVALFLQVIIVGSVGKAGIAEAEQKGTLMVVQENDAFYKTDGHYTNGLKVAWVPGEKVPVPKWALALSDTVILFPRQGNVHHGYAIGQNIYTPTDITLDDPPEDDRPYAGWFYGSIGLGIETDRQLDVLFLTVGIVGPASLAEENQKYVHRVIGTDTPQGWHTQLKNEIGMVAGYMRSWRGVSATSLLGVELDITPYIGASLGNVFTHASTGLTFRYGKYLPDDYGAPRINSGLPGAADFTPSSRFGWYLFFAVEGRAIARDIFLDGNTFRESRSVEKRPLVADIQAGFVLDWDNFRFSYTHVLRTREFESQTGNDNFGAINVMLKL